MKQKTYELIEQELTENGIKFSIPTAGHYSIESPLREDIKKLTWFPNSCKFQINYFEKKIEYRNSNNPIGLIKEFLC